MKFKKQKNQLRSNMKILITIIRIIFLLKTNKYNKNKIINNLNKIIQIINNK